MNYFSIPQEWLGKTALVVGGGPSAVLVRGHEAEIYRKFKTIVVNDGVFLLPYAEVLYFRDKAWWNFASNGVSRAEWVRKNFFGKYLLTSENDIWGVARLHETGATGLAPESYGIRHGSNSGYQAIHVAHHFGVNRIVLIGFDMQLVAGYTHYNHNHMENQNAAGFAMTLRDSMLPKFETLREPLQTAGVEVLNASPNSALRVWPLVDFEEILNVS